MSTKKQVTFQTIECQYCARITPIHVINRHLNACYLNPNNVKYCVVCSKPIKNWKKGTTCSYSCSNKHYKRRKDENRHYRSLCFKYHGKKCLVCEERKIVAVHHIDENKANNHILNLAPICPTHHQYMHSKYKCEIIHIIEEFQAFNLTRPELVNYQVEK